jgi:hypothetical protein
MATTPRFFTMEGAPDYLHKRALFYERKTVTDLWNRLTVVAKMQWKWKSVAESEKPNDTWRRTQKRMIQVYGSPGVGKSTAVFHWVSQVCKSLGTQALWSNCEFGSNAGSCWMIERNEADGSVKTSPRAALLSVNDVDCATVSIVVFDDVRTSSVDSTYGNTINELARRGILVVLVSSEWVFIPRGGSQDILKLEQFVESWRMDEYLEACKNDIFWKENCETIPDATEHDSERRRAELLEAKFHIAGHCARFMFRESANNVIEQLTRKALDMGGIESLRTAVIADRSKGAVNTLIARFLEIKDGRTPAQEAVFPSVQDLSAAASTTEELEEMADEFEMQASVPRLVSARAAQEVLLHIRAKVETLLLVARASQNKAIEGYAFEEQLKTKLGDAARLGSDLYLGTANGTLMALPVSHLKFCSTDSLITHLQVDQPNDTWIFIGGLQGAFDAIHVVSNERIRFVQLTVGLTHSFKLNIITVLMKELLVKHNKTWSHLEFMVLRPVDGPPNFRLLDAIGDLPAYTRFDEQPWDRSDYCSNVVYTTLSW